MVRSADRSLFVGDTCAAQLSRRSRAGNFGRCRCKRPEKKWWSHLKTEVKPPLHKSLARLLLLHRPLRGTGEGNSWAWSLTSAPAFHAHGLSMILTAPSAFCWNISYAAGASRSGSRCVAKSSTPSGSSSVRNGMMAGIQRFTLA